ncbi:hypothetical protein AC578_10553 [Pseudocercospora eumusae]|uniref:Uncharacterized protein n=1 Tax=Pseudocercospora eumusae TaxID=321146 RepID=A0A139H5A6_9PEZI|nr:hypothetical protein AC578_10553 [Pseudocercospora eumusae]
MPAPLPGPADADAARILKILDAKNIPSAHHIQPSVLAELYAKYGDEQPGKGLVASMTQFWNRLNKAGPVSTDTGIVDTLGRHDYIKECVWYYETYHEHDYTSSSIPSSTSTSTSTTSTSTSGSTSSSFSRRSELQSWLWPAIQRSKPASSIEGGTREIEDLFAELGYQSSKIQDLESTIRELRRQNLQQARTIKNYSEQQETDKNKLQELVSRNRELRQQNLEQARTAKTDKKETVALKQRVSELGLRSGELSREVAGLQRERDQTVSRLRNKQVKEENKTAILRGYSELGHKARRACAHRLLVTVEEPVLNALRALTETDVLTAVQAFESAAAAVLEGAEDSLHVGGKTL